MNIKTNSGLVIAMIALSAPFVVASALADEGTGRCAIALWYFNGSGIDQLGGHDISTVDDASFVPTCGSTGLFTDDDDSYGWYKPIGKLSMGTIAFQFELDAPFGPNATYPGPIHFMVSDRDGDHVGDVSVQLSGEDGKLWFVQEDAAPSPSWALGSTRSTWDANTCYRVEIEWGPAGRVMKVTTPGYFEWNEDQVSRPFAFSLDATETEVLSREDDASEIGVALNWLEVAYPCPPVATEEVSWGRVKSLYR